MGSDRARKTWDARQQYRGVVWQQGRVTLEADGNEAEDIRAAESRAELVDVIGPSGTPDDGYKLSLPAPPPAGWLPYDFNIGAGGFYVGGVRVSQATATSYFHQPEWVDGPDLPAVQPQRELIALLVSEQEVSAVEDSALREVALGGPDSAQRLRSVPHVLRVPVSTGGCEAAFAQAVTAWQKLGLAFDPASHELRSVGRLKVDFVPDPGPVNECEPAAQTGFLGAENQLVRVQVSGAGKLLWGYDNASFLYRIDATSATTLRLKSTPVDVFHQPRAGQYVEILRAGVLLGNGEYAAAPTGFVVKLAAGYDADAQTVVLDTALPAIFRDATSTPRLFLRVWEGELPFTVDTPVALGTTGVRVTLHTGPFVVGDFWQLGVRPSHPQAIYPERLLAGFQPPDGPRRQVTSLGVITWTSATTADIEDCRDPFDDLVELSRRLGAGCCTIKIRPEDVRAPGAFQHLLDRYAGKSQHVVICLAPGRYELAEPLRLGKDHSHFTIEGCSDGAVLAAAPGREEAFHEGLVVLQRANELELRQLRFDMPLGRLKPGDFPNRAIYDAVAKNAGGRSLFTSIGLNATHCANLFVRDCLFRATLSESGLVFGAGLKASGGAWWPRVERCRFLHDEEYLRRPQDLNFLVGYLYGATLFPSQGDTGDGGGPGAEWNTVIDELRLDACEFAGLDVAVAIIGRTGVLHIERNVVRECRGGFVIENLSAPSFLLSRAPRVSTLETPVAREMVSRLAEVYGDAARELGLLVLRTSGAPAGSIAAPLGLNLAAGEAEHLHAWETLFDRAAVSAAAPARDVASVATATRETTATRDTVDVRPLVTDPRAAVLRDLVARLDREVPRGASERLMLRLHVSGNDVRTLGVDGATMFGMFMVDLDTGVAGDFAISSNCFRGASAGPVVTVFTPSCGTITGNTIVNEAQRQGDSPRRSLNVISLDKRDPLVAVTGNVLVGLAQLPNRPSLPAPLNSWLPFNAYQEL